MIAALYVETDGCYFGLPGVDPWDKKRDARKYNGPHPVVAHPPCNRWIRLGLVNFVRYGGDHNRLGNDGGCFSAALNAVNKYGGVLEHPAYSYAWAEFGLNKPTGGGWNRSGIGWTCEVWQSAYGHKAAKATWLYYHGDKLPPILNWCQKNGTHQVGFQESGRKDRSKPVLSKAESNATPVAFRDVLIDMAGSARVFETGDLK